jgi:hypothetical protein
LSPLIKGGRGVVRGIKGEGGRGVVSKEIIGRKSKQEKPSFSKKLGFLFLSF